MLKHVYRVLLVYLVLFFTAGPLFAQASYIRRFNRPLEDNSVGAGASFRQKDMQDQMDSGSMMDGSEQGLLNRGMMMTSPTTSGMVYQIHILGEVKNPGTYRVMASERLAEALQKAGGVAEQGSDRRIEIRRNGKTERTVDLLKFKIYGQLDNNPYLLDNDVVYIPLKSKTVQVVGAVKRPDLYDVMNEKSVADVIQLAGGYSTGVSKDDPVKVIRFVNGEKQVNDIPDASGDLRTFLIENGDVVYIPSVVTAGRKFDYDVAKLPGGNVFYPSYEDRVFVLGGVSQPGAYPFSPFYNVHQYISLAGGYTQLSTKSIKIVSPSGKKSRYNPSKNLQINPGDTIMIGQRRIPPEGWVGLAMSLASFGLSTTATVITLTDRK